MTIHHKSVLTPQKRTALLLAVLQLAALASCAHEAPVSDDSTSGSDTPAAESTRIPLPEGNYEGQQVNVFLWEQSGLNIEKETGDIVDDAIYRRNRAAEEHLGITMKITEQSGGVYEFDSWLETLNASILADDDSIQLAGGYGYRLAASSLGGYYHNLNELSAIDFSKPWWPSKIQEAGNLGGAMYLAIGNLEPGYYNASYAMFFNKEMAETLKTGNLYDLVKSGGWTVDKLIEYSKLASDDINGDTKLDNKDRYGLLAGAYMEVDAFYSSCDIRVVERDADNLPSVTPLSAHYTDVQETLRDFLRSSGDVFYDTTYADKSEMFKGGLGLFETCGLGAAEVYRSLEMDFGILPYPKWDDAQEDYYTYNAIGNATTYVVPVTADGEMMGALLETMAILGYEDVLPAYYDIALKAKGVRDEESAEMLDIIFDGIALDFTQIYSFCFGDQLSPSMMLRTSIYQDTELASLWAANETVFASTMQTLIDSLQ